MSIQEILAGVVSFNDESFLRTGGRLQFRSGPERRLQAAELLMHQKFALRLPEAARTQKALSARCRNPLLSACEVTHVLDQP